MGDGCLVAVLALGGEATALVHLPHAHHAVRVARDHTRPIEAPLDHRNGRFVNRVLFVQHAISVVPQRHDALIV